MSRWTPATTKGNAINTNNIQYLNYIHWNTVAKYNNWKRTNKSNFNTNDPLWWSKRSYTSNIYAELGKFTFASKKV